MTLLSRARNSNLLSWLVPAGLLALSLDGASAVAALVLGFVAREPVPGRP